jgi:glycosyltransferase involved in cell wall biosynthesis
MQTLLQLREVVRRGHRVTVIDLRPRQEGPREEQIEGIRVIRILTPRAPVFRALAYHLRLVSSVIRAARGVDVVQVNHIGTALITASFVLSGLRVPRILVLWGSAADGVGPFRRTLRFALARRLARRCERIISLASAAIPNLERHGFDPRRIRHIANGVDTQRFRPHDGAAGDDPLPGGWPRMGPVAISVARLVPAKAHDVLLDAWTEVVRAHPGATLLVVGEGPLRDEIEVRSRRLGIGGSLRMLGTQNDVPALLGRSDLYVSSSRTEGMSNAILEAASCGLPVVATRVGGAADVIEDGVTGLLVPPGDAAALAGAIEGLLRDPERRARMGALARRRAVELFSIEAVVEQYIDQYRELSRR